MIRRSLFGFLSSSWFSAECISPLLMVNIAGLARVSPLKFGDLLAGGKPTSFLSIREEHGSLQDCKFPRQPVTPRPA